MPSRNYEANHSLYHKEQNSQLTRIAWTALLMLHGCGGGGGSSIDTVPIPDPTPIVKTTFGSTPLELPIFQDYFLPAEKKCAGSLPMVSAVDLNNDGRKDLVVHMWCGVGETNMGKPKSEPTDDALTVFLQKSNGTFEYANEQVFGTKSVRFYASSRKVVIADFNNDGYQDLAYAVNQEDGREVNQDSSSQFAKSVVVLSQANGKYTVDTLGTPNWFHSVEAIKTNTGFDAVFAGFTGPKQAFRFVNGAWLDVSDQYPNVSASTFRSSPDGKTVVTTTDNAYPGNSASLAKYELSNTGWSKTLEQLVNGSYIPYLGWNNSLSSVFAVAVDNKIHIAAGYDESCFLNLTPTNTVFVGKYSANVVSNYVNGTTIAQRDFQNQNNLTLKSFKLADLTPMPSIIENEVTDTNYIYIKCSDINNDGYGDIVVYPQWQNTQDSVIVYLNNKQGKLAKVDSSIFPVAPYINTTSLYEDFDNDGIPDLLYWSVSANHKPLLYKGNKLLGQ